MKKIDSTERLIVFNASGTSRRGNLSISPEQLQDIGVYDGKKEERLLQVIRYDGFIVLAPKGTEPNENELSQISRDVKPLKSIIKDNALKLKNNIDELLKSLES